MAVKVHLDVGYEFEVKARFGDVFALLSDVPASIAHMPKVEKLTDLGGGVYQLEMQKVGTAQAHIQTVYASKYVNDRRHGTVQWTPVPGVGNALVAGSWKITDHHGRSTRLVLKIDGTADVPLPAMMKVVVEPIVKAEFEKVIEKYIANLIREFGGEV